MRLELSALILALILALLDKSNGADYNDRRAGSHENTKKRYQPSRQSDTCIDRFSELDSSAAIV